MAKISHLSHVMIMQATKPHAVCIHNLGARAQKWSHDLKSLESANNTQLNIIMLLQL